MLKSLRENVQQETPDELVRGERHRSENQDLQDQLDAIADIIVPADEGADDDYDDDGDDDGGN